MKAVILAGGRGERLGKITDKLQKTMIKIGGLPVLRHQINLLLKYGVKDIIFLTAYRPEDVKEYFGDGKRLGAKIRYFNEDNGISTTGERFKEIEGILKEDFLVLYGDVMINLDIKKIVMFHKEKKSDCTIAIHPNSHPYDSDLLEIDVKGRVIAFYPKPRKKGKYLKNLVNGCFYVMSPKVLKYVKKGERSDFGRDVFPKIFKKIKIYGYKTHEYLKDMGTPERLKEVIEDFKKGRIKKRKTSAIFLDRDGTINNAKEDVCRLEDFKLYPFSGKAIKKINNSDFLAILATNQPGIAKGYFSFKELENIHKKMETLLGEEGAKLDGIYFCPHHPNKFSDGNKKYQIACNCRKPKIGMIMQAKKDFNLDLKNSWMIGDFDWDIMAGRKAGLSTIGVRTGKNKGHFKVKPDYIFDNLEKAVKFVTK